MVLATLARHGPRHGHEIRRLAEVTNVGEWGGVSVGALYRELRTMEGEGLVDPVRTEQVGPAAGQDHLRDYPRGLDRVRHAQGARGQVGALGS